MCLVPALCLLPRMLAVLTSEDSLSPGHVYAFGIGQWLLVPLDKEVVLEGCRLPVAGRCVGLLQRPWVQVADWDKGGGESGCPCGHGTLTRALLYVLACAVVTHLALSPSSGSALLRMVGGLGRGLLQHGLVPLPGWGLCLPESERLWQ